MAKVVVKAKVKKIKRKFPVQLVAPEFLNSVSLGHTSVSDLNLMVGKTSKMNMMYITKNIKNQNVRLVFKVVEVSSGLAKTVVSSYMQIPYYLGRFVKVGSDLIEDSFVVKSKDGVLVRIKPFIVTKANASEMVLSSLRAESRKLLEKELTSIKAEEFMASVINGKVQGVFRNELKKIFPLKAFEFRRVDLE
ncbi:MAG: hypothetical protein KC589_10130 [Nanoarchaeota archaeon]|nr:hypothetical protein [Nanoarchaeota archaeon]